MKNRLLFLMTLLFSLNAVSSDALPATVENPTDTALEAIPSLDVSRYMGTWFEIAKFPNRFQKQCTGHTSARYSLQKDGTVHVINRCRLENGEMNSAIGTARQIGPQDSPKLKVRFAPAWLSFLPLVWGDYWVIDLDEDYQLVAISEPTREYLWILSRTPSVDSEAYIQMLERLSSKGFEIHKLELTRQD